MIKFEAEELSLLLVANNMYCGLLRVAITVNRIDVVFRLPCSITRYCFCCILS